MNNTELAAILGLHVKWLHGENGDRVGDENGGERADLSGADLKSADMSGAALNGADLSFANLSGAKNLTDAVAWLADSLERDERGYLVYKQFGAYYACPARWAIEPGSVLTEVANPDRCNSCACGVNVATRGWIRRYGDRALPLWRALIRWEWLPGVVVPYQTEGEIRCSHAELLEPVEFPA